MPAHRLFFCNRKRDLKPCVVRNPHHVNGCLYESLLRATPVSTTPVQHQRENTENTDEIQTPTTQ